MKTQKTIGNIATDLYKKNSLPVRKITEEYKLKINLITPNSKHPKNQNSN